MIDIFVLFVVIAAILFLGVFGEIFFSRTRIPSALILIVTGLIVGPIFGLISPNPASDIIQFFVAIALIIVLFDSGLHLNIYNIINTSSKSTLLSVLAFFGSMAVVFVILMAVNFLGIVEISIINAVIIGAVLGGTSSVIVIPMLQKAKVPSKVEDLVTLETEISDSLAGVIALALIPLTIPSGAGVQSIASAVISQFAIAIVLGFILGLVWLYILKTKPMKKVKTKSYTLTFAALLLIYAAVNFVGGSAPIACLVFGIVLGNTSRLNTMLKLKNKIFLEDRVEEFHSLITFFIRTIFFALIGMFVILEPKFLAIGLVLAVAIVIPRKKAVDFVLKGERILAKHKQIIYAMVPRGLAAATFAAVPLTMGIPGAEIYPAIVYPTILFSVLITTGMYYRTLKIHKHKLRAN